MYLKEIVVVLIGVVLSTIVSLISSSFMFVRRVDKIELMLQNLINQTGLQHSDLKTHIQELRTEIVRLDREMQNVKERLRVMEEKTK